jgi:hypothetical protein
MTDPAKKAATAGEAAPKDIITVPGDMTMAKVAELLAEGVKLFRD